MEMRVMKITENTKERDKENTIIRKIYVSKTDITHIPCKY